MMLETLAEQRTAIKPGRSCGGDVPKRAVTTAL